MSNAIDSADSGSRLTAMASRGRAVKRISRGLLAIYGGVGSMIAVVLANGLGTTAQLLGQAGSIVLFSTGCLLIASAAPHLARFGGRLGAFSLASFAAAGIGGLVALAEMYTTYVAGSNVLQSWDEPATLASAAFAVTGISLLKLAQRAQGSRPVSSAE